MNMTEPVTSGSFTTVYPEVIFGPSNASKQIDKLAAAVAEAQGEMENAKKDSDNPYFNSKYADLASCMDACRKPLAKNKLGVIQRPIGDCSEIVSVETILVHASGQWISSTFGVRPGYINKAGDFVKEQDAQAIGTCITYLRRYGLCSITGVVSDDDDGNRVSGRKPSANGESNGATKSNYTPERDRDLKAESDNIVISEAQRKRLFAICKSKNVSEQSLKDYISNYNIRSTKDIQRRYYDEICNAIESGKLSTVQPDIEEPAQEAPASSEVNQELSWRTAIIPIGKKYKGMKLGDVDDEAKELYMFDWLPVQKDLLKEGKKLSPEEKFFVSVVDEMVMEIGQQLTESRSNRK